MQGTPVYYCANALLRALLAASRARATAEESSCTPLAWTAAAVHPLAIVARVVLQEHISHTTTTDRIDGSTLRNLDNG